MATLDISSFEKKQSTQAVNRLTDRISQIDNQIATGPSPDLIKERLLLQAEFDTVTSTDIEKMLLKSRHSYYEFGEKAHRLLAHQLRQSSAFNVITEIKTQYGVTRDYLEINSAFRDYNISLYNSEQNCTLLEMERFFERYYSPPD